MNIYERATCKHCGQAVVRVYQTVDIWDHWRSRGFTPCENAEPTREGEE